MNQKRYIGKVSVGTKMRRALWNVSCMLLFRPFGTKLFRLWRIFLLRLFGARVSWHSEVYSSVKLWAPWNLEMEEGACLGPEVICYNQGRVVIRRDACVSQYACLCTADHAIDAEVGEPAAPLNNARCGLIVADIELQRESWIGMQAYVGMGVTVGECAVVGARANVFKDVPSKTKVYAAVGHSASL